MIGSDHQPICVTGNAIINASRKTSDINNKQSYMLETAAHTDLPSGVVVNCSYGTPKAESVGYPDKYYQQKYWIRQSLLAANIWGRIASNQVGEEIKPKVSYDQETPTQHLDLILKPIQTTPLKVRYCDWHSNLT